MNEIVLTVGKRIRNYRNKLGISQEELAERCGLHPTYIGQLERGEKNPTIDTVVKVSSALGISLSTLFEKIDDNYLNENERPLPLIAYQLIQDSPKSDHEKLVNFLKAITDYGNSK